MLLCLSPLVVAGLGKETADPAEAAATHVMSPSRVLAECFEFPEVLGLGRAAHRGHGGGGVAIRPSS